MSKASSTNVALNASAIVIAFAATMIAMWSFAHERLVWGGYNFVIALVALSVVAAARARDHDA